MENKRGMKLFTLFAFLSILLILSSVVVSGQANALNKDISFEYDHKKYYYNTESTKYQTEDGKFDYKNIPSGAENIKGFKEGFKVEPGFFSSLEEGGKIATFLEKYDWTRYTFGPGDEKNILQRGLSALGYGNESFFKTKLWSIIIFGVIGIIGFGIAGYFFGKKQGGKWWIAGGIAGGILGGFFVGGAAGAILSLLPGLISIALAGGICYGIIKIISNVIDSATMNGVPVAEDIRKSLLYKVAKDNYFVIFYILFFGSLYVLIDFIPILSIFKILLLPLFTDFGASIVLPFTNSFMKNFGITVMRGVALGLSSTLLLIALIILFNANTIIIDLINNYKAAKAKIASASATQDILNFIQLARYGGQQMRT
ncbi:MAG: hypothetical protein Q7R87_00935 [Nanoarchaeota archaeon]|nr:hypothetical protein [Nanoarchaeota archaeon]